MVSNPANERTKKRNINMIRNIKKGEDSDIFKTRGHTTNKIKFLQTLEEESKKTALS